MEGVPAEQHEQKLKPRRTRKIGSRMEVYEGKCVKTSGGLTREDLVLNPKTGKICTHKQIERGKELYQKLLERKKETS